MVELGGAILAGLLPAAFAARHVLASPDLDRDRALLRVTSGAATGVFRALDAIVARPFLWLPGSSITAHAALAQVVALAAFGVGAYRIGIALGRTLDRRDEPVALRSFVALSFALLLSFTTATQLEATVCGGAVLGALLAIAPLWAWVDGRPGVARTLRTALLFGLAATYEPLVAAVAAALLLPSVADPRALSALRHPRFAFALSAGIFVAALPPLIALLRRRVAPELELPGGIFAHPITESYQLGTKNPWPLVYRELGIVPLAFAAVGAAFAALRARRLGIGLVLGALVGFAGVRLGANASDTRAAAAVVAALGALTILAGAGMYAVVDRVAGARIPFARLSATLLVLFALAIVARNADDASFALAARAASPTDSWERTFAGGFAPGAIVLVPRRDMYEHALAARVRGALGQDVLLVPLFDAGGSATIAALRSEPKLGGVLRDVALEGAPTEYALSELATAREVDVLFDPSWSRSVARHFVPSGLALRFSIEPRGTSDRRAAREAGLGDLAALTATIAKHEDLRGATIALLRLRALAAVVADDREATIACLGDLRAVAPKDDLATRVAPPKPPPPPRDVRGHADAHR